MDKFGEIIKDWSASGSLEDWSASGSLEDWSASGSLARPRGAKHTPDARLAFGKAFRVIKRRRRSPLRSNGGKRAACAPEPLALQSLFALQSSKI